MLEIIEQNDGFKLARNGEILEGIQLHEAESDGDRRFILIVMELGVEKIETCPFPDLPVEVRQIILPGDPEYDGWRFEYIERIDDTNEFLLRYCIAADLTSWKEPYSFNEYSQEFMRMESPNFDVLDGDDDIYIKTVLHSPQLTIMEEFKKCANLANQFSKEVAQSLLSRVHENSVLTYFDFPEAVKVPCEQYLLYFIQFLKDLGIEANAEVQHEAGQILFAVTPADKEMGLDKIRAALDIYMGLPASPTSDMSSNDEIAIQRLEANIYHLKSQLKLAHAEMLSNERTIQAQQTIINS